MSRLPETKEEIRLLLDLAGMWRQFCPDNWHGFLSVTEATEETLREYGLLIDQPDKNPRFNDALEEKLEDILAPNQDLETHLENIKRLGL